MALWGRTSLQFCPFGLCERVVVAVSAAPWPVGKEREPQEECRAGCGTLCGRCVTIGLEIVLRRLVDMHFKHGNGLQLHQL